MDVFKKMLVVDFYRDLEQWYLWYLPNGVSISIFGNMRLFILLEPVLWLSRHFFLLVFVISGWRGGSEIYIVYKVARPFFLLEVFRKNAGDNVGLFDRMAVSYSSGKHKIFCTHYVSFYYFVNDSVIMLLSRTDRSLRNLQHWFLTMKIPRKVRKLYWQKTAKKRNGRTLKNMSEERLKEIDRMLLHR